MWSVLLSFNDNKGNPHQAKTQKQTLQYVSYQNQNSNNMITLIVCMGVMYIINCQIPCPSLSSEATAPLFTF